MDEETKSISERIPFVMLVAAVFFRGIIFTSLDGPLMLLVLEDVHFSTLSDLISNGLLKAWGAFMNVQSTFSSAFFFILMILLIGFVTTPLEQIFAAAIALLIEIPKMLKLRRIRIGEFSLYSPFVYPNKEFIKVMEWLAYNPPAKAQWEWQQFYFHMWWSCSVSFIIFSVFSLRLINVSAQQQAMFILLLVVIIFVLGGIYHSWHMGNVHRQAISRMLADKKFLKSL
jgi:hypothetical protein